MLIRSTTGVIFKDSASATITHYKTSDYSWTAATVSIDYSSFSAYMGTINWSSLVLKQTRDDPLNYLSTETAPPNIIGFMNNDYIY